MSKATDEQWERHLAQAAQDLRVQPSRASNFKLNLALFLTPLGCLLVAFLWPKQFEGLAFAVWILGGLSAFSVLVVYASSNQLSHNVKEAALSFLLGDLIVLGLMLLKPV